MGSVGPGQPSAPGTQNAAGLTQGSPPAVAEKLCETPAKGLAMRSKPGRCVPPVMLNGCPVWKDHRELSCQPWVRIFGPQEAPGISYTQAAVKLWRVSKSALPYSAFKLKLFRGITPRYSVTSSRLWPQV